MKSTIVKLHLLALAVLLTPISAVHSQDASGFAAACDAAAKKAAAAGERMVVGADPSWLFLNTELRHLATGNFWEKDWTEVAVSKTDPVPIFLDLKDKLAALGVEFVFVPVPAKASIYPEKFTDAGKPDAIAPFLKRLSDGGIKVIDLEPLLKADGGLTYCMTDSHPTPSTCELIAKQVASHFAGQPWAKVAKEAAGIDFEVSDPVETAIKGDLIPDAKRSSWPAEMLPVRKATSGGKPVAPQDNSPVILVGDSHALIYQMGGEMLLTGAGVLDHLQAELGFPVMLKASRGPSNQQVKRIFQPADFWEGKKALVWVSSVREFTQQRRWQRLPRLPK